MSAPAKPLVAYTIVKDGFLPGFLPAYRVVTVTVKDGKAKTEPSEQKYVIEEALAILEDKQREGLGL